MHALTVGLIAIAFCAFSSASQAQPFLSGATGAGRINIECGGAPGCDKTERAHRLIAGYRFASGVMAELGVASYGTATQRFGALMVRTTAAGGTAGLALNAPFNTWYGLTGRAGLAWLKTEESVITLGVVTRSEKNFAPYAGLGFYVAPWRNVRIELCADFSQAEFMGEKSKVRAILLGARTEF